VIDIEDFLNLTEVDTVMVTRRIAKIGFDREQLNDFMSLLLGHEIDSETREAFIKAAEQGLKSLD